MWSISDGRITTGATNLTIQDIHPGTIRIVTRSRISLTRTHTLGRTPLIATTNMDTAPVIVTVDLASGGDSFNSLLEQRRF